jgi:rhomboid protease GluP
MDAGIDWRVVFEGANQTLSNEQALVLAAARIPHRIVHDQSGYVLIVPADYSAAAARELRMYAEENPLPVPAARHNAETHPSAGGIVAYVAVLFAVAWLASRHAFGADWYAAGGIDGDLVRAGDGWRLVTALTLHADPTHLAGNLVFGALFGLFAGRLLGAGVAWLAILTCAAGGNLLNTLLLASEHRSIGASTAVFSALGIVAGHVWHGRLMPRDRWVFRAGPVVGGVALLAYTGMGGGLPDRQVDVGAHVMGFVCGFAGGMLLVHLVPRLQRPYVQSIAGTTALAAILIAWTLALH